MRKKGLVSCWRRKKRKVITTDSNHNQPVAPNKLDRDFTALAANQKWVGDITGVWTDEGWLYLAALVDLYSRKVVGWAITPLTMLRTFRSSICCRWTRSYPEYYFD